MTPTLIVDCSVVMAWCFVDEATAETKAVQDRLTAESALVPSHWYLEVSNVLAGAEKRKRISTADVQLFIQLLSQFDIQPEEGEARATFPRVLPLCRAHGLTSYDAAYLELAIRRRLPLATLDDDLRAAAKKCGVTLLGK